MPLNCLLDGCTFNVQNKHILCLSEDRADENLNKPGIGEWKSYADDVAKAAELLKLADTQEEGTFQP